MFHLNRRTTTNTATKISTLITNCNRLCTLSTAQKDESPSVHNEDQQMRDTCPKLASFINASAAEASRPMMAGRNTSKMLFLTTESLCFNISFDTQIITMKGSQMTDNVARNEPRTPRM